MGCLRGAIAAPWLACVQQLLQHGAASVQQLLHHGLPTCSEI